MRFTNKCQATTIWIKLTKMIALSMLCLPVSASAGGLEDLESRLHKVTSGKKAQIGVAVILDHKDTVTVNNDCRYPMMSVFKLHQALAVADYCLRERLTLDSPIHIRRKDLKPNTYSPLRDKHPEGDISLSIRELLRYTMHWSDNNACDILFDRTGGPEATDKYIRGLGLRNFSIKVNEDEMHRDPNACYLNWSTPLDTAKLIELLLTHKLLNKEWRAFIRETMISCQTGKDRLPFPLQKTKAIIGHKTGTGDRNENGQLTGTNDAGFVRLPDGREYTIVVFVKDSSESEEDTARIIAEVSETVYRYACSQE